MAEIFTADFHQFKEAKESVADSRADRSTTPICRKNIALVILGVTRYGSNEILQKVSQEQAAITNDSFPIFARARTCNA